MSKSLLAAPHSMCELRALLCKTAITIADIIFKPMPYLQVVTYCIACGLLFYYHARMVRGSARREAGQAWEQPAMPNVHMPAALTHSCQNPWIGWVWHCCVHVLRMMVMTVVYTRAAIQLEHIY
jgi:hypothetical protein